MKLASKNSQQEKQRRKSSTSAEALDNGEYAMKSLSRDNPADIKLASKNNKPLSSICYCPCDKNGFCFKCHMNTRHSCICHKPLAEKIKELEKGCNNTLAYSDGNCRKEILCGHCVFRLEGYKQAQKHYAQAVKELKDKLTWTNGEVVDYKWVHRVIDAKFGDLEK